MTTQDLINAAHEDHGYKSKDQLIEQIAFLTHARDYHQSRADSLAYRLEDYMESKEEDI